jgi:hypothetical protein
MVVSILQREHTLQKTREGSAAWVEIQFGFDAIELSAFRI